MRPRALVVDDHEDVRRVVVATVETLGFDVTQAWDAAGALAAWKARRHDGPFALAVLDNFFPAHKGAFSRPHAVPFARLIREDGVPVVVFSGDVSWEDGAELTELGVEWIQKPDTQGLAAAIRRAAKAHTQAGEPPTQEER